MPPILTPVAPGVGAGWDRLVPVIAAEIPPAEIDGAWVFRVLRHGPDEWGTAVISRVHGDRRRIYTARFVLAVKGKRRGGFTANLAEVGSGPIEALEELLALVPRRADDDDPLVAVHLPDWFPPETDAPGDA